MQKLLFIGTLFLAAGTFYSTGCSDSAEATIAGQTIKVACAACVYKMEDAKGCEWAAEVDGEHLMVQGMLPVAHDSHGPEGMCNMEREAKIDAAVRDGKLITSRFELLPPKNAPETPQFTPADIH